MNSNIHPTALVSETAKIDSSVVVGPFCNIGPNVIIEKNSHLISNVIIDGNTNIGSNCIFYPFSVIGMNPQDLKYKGEKTKLQIGNNNIFREHSTIHIGTKGGGGVTIIGNENLVMTGVHIAHDCKIGNNIVLSHHVALAGHVKIDDFAILSAMVGVVQFRRIGSYSMVGGLCAVDTDIVPFAIASAQENSRAFINGVNIIGMRRKGFSRSEINEVTDIFGKLFDNTKPLKERISSIKLNVSSSKNFNLIKNFLDVESNSGICQPKTENL